MCCGALAAGALAACGPVTEHVSQDVCASETRWIGDESGDPEMKPGNACIDCHSREDGPKFAFAGTVYSDVRQDNDCFGVSGVEIELTDADGKSFKGRSNGAGNFYITGKPTMPFTATLTYEGTEYTMNTPADTGDCNSCHTKEGKNNAVGRIFINP